MIWLFFYSKELFFLEMLGLREKGLFVMKKYFKKIINTLFVYDIEYKDIGCNRVKNFCLILYNKPIECKD